MEESKNQITVVKKGKRKSIPLCGVVGRQSKTSYLLSAIQIRQSFPGPWLRRTGTRSHNLCEKEMHLVVIVSVHVWFNALVQKERIVSIYITNVNRPWHRHCFTSDNNGRRRVLCLGRPRRIPRTDDVSVGFTYNTDQVINECALHFLNGNCVTTIYYFFIHLAFKGE